MIDSNVLKNKIKNALLQESERNISLSAKCDKKSDICEVGVCNRHVYCKGLCHGHYLRSKNGGEMSTPIRSRKRNDKCKKCDEPTHIKAGWDLCGSCYRNKKFNLIKGILLEEFGNKCNRCKITYDNYCVYDFHHIEGKKEFGISYAILNISIDKLVDEVIKCELVCANCHRIIHGGK